MTRTRVIVDRKMWLRGEGAEDSYLLRDTDQKMCCLGFACLALGATEEQIHQAQTPHGILAKHPSAAEGPLSTIINYSNAVDTAMEVNDDRYGMYSTSEAAREARLTELLAGVGLDLEFTGER